MSALAAAKPVKQSSQSLAQSEADLRTEATAIEKLRKQISEGGATTSKEMMAEFAKRQKAYLDRKIELEKQKRSLTEAPASKAETPKPEPVKAPEPQKPAAEKKPEAPKTVASAPAAKKSEPAKPEKPSQKAEPAKAPEKKAAEPKKKDATKEKSEVKPAKPESEKSSAKKDEPKPETSPSKKSGGVSPIVWILVLAAAAVAAWHFLG